METRDDKRLTQMSWDLHGESQLAFRDITRVLTNSYRYSDILSVSWSQKDAGRDKTDVKHPFRVWGKTTW